MALAAVLWLAGPRPAPLTARAQGQNRPVVTLQPAPPISFASHTDSNSPALWSLVSGRQYLYVINSVAGRSTQSRGLALDKLAPLASIKWSTAAPLGGAWFEAIIQDPAGANWYGYYHNERENVVCPGTGKVIPSIGAARSSDRGLTWRDLGIVLEAPPATERCDTNNHYFVGGVGDFSVMLDEQQQYVYFFYTQYFERNANVGVSLARMNWADRNAPTKKMQVWNAGAWLPGSNQTVTQADGRRVTQFVYKTATPTVKAQDAWDSGSEEVDVFWGPSLHWNTTLNRYVALMSRAVDAQWAQEGVYISYGTRLDDPRTWTPPERILQGGQWYPQVMGLDPGGTDKQAGATARLFMSGLSEYLIQFAFEDTP